MGLGAIVLIPVRTYYLDPIDVGTYALIMAVLTPIGALSNLGSGWVMAGNYFSSDENERRRMLSTLVILDLSVGLILTLLAFFFGIHLMDQFFDGFSDEWGVSFRMALIGSLLGLPVATVSYHMVMRKDSKNQAMLEIFPFIIGNVLTIVAFLIGMRLLALFLGVLVSGLVQGCMCVIYLRHHGEFRISSRWVRESFKTGLPAVPVNLMMSFQTVLERYLLQRSLGLGALGVYSHSQTYREILRRAFKAFNKVFNPELLQSYENGTVPESLMKQYRTLLQISAIGGLLCIGLSEPLIDLLTHGKFIEAAKFVPAWYGIILCSLWVLPYLQFLLHAKQTRFVSKTTIGSTVLGMAVMWLLIPGLGSWGALLGMLSMELFLLCFARRKALAMGCPDKLGLTAYYVCFAYGVIVCSDLYLDGNKLATGILLGAGFFLWGYYFNFHQVLSELIQSRRPPSGQ